MDWEERQLRDSRADKVAKHVLMQAVTGEVPGSTVARRHHHAACLSEALKQRLESNRAEHI